MPIQVLVQVHPQPTAEANKRLLELVPYLMKGVQETEPWISEYTGYTTPVPELGEDAFDNLIFFTIDSEEKLKERTSMPHFVEISKILREENLLRAPLKYSVLKRIDGFKR